MKIFLKAFYQNKLVKNYVVIIFLIAFVITSLFLTKKYFFKIINDNYQGSYVLISTNNSFKIEHENIKEIKKCVVEADNIIIADNIKNEQKEYEKSIDNSLEMNIIRIPLSKFDDYKYEDIYYLEIEDWMKINDTIIYLNDNGYEMETYTKKKIEMPIENYYQYLDIIIIIILIIGFIIFIISIENIIIDESKSHNLYKCLGYNKKNILSVQITRIFSILLIVIAINEIIQIIVRKFAKIVDYTNLIVYSLFVITSFVLIIINKLKNNDK